MIGYGKIILIKKKTFFVTIMSYHIIESKTASIAKYHFTE